jgi:hypothetical protein
MTAKLTPTGADLKLIEALATGGIADYGSADSIENDPANGHPWGEDARFRSRSFMRCQP